MKKTWFSAILSIVRSSPTRNFSIDREMDRRRFFRAGLAEVLRPLEAAVRPLEHMAHHVGKLDAAFPVPPEPAPPRAAPVGAVPAETGAEESGANGSPHPPAAPADPAEQPWARPWLR